jgi:hypothetical protein
MALCMVSRSTQPSGYTTYPGCKGQHSSRT